MRGTEGRQVLEALSVFCCFLCGKRMPAGGYTRKDMQGAHPPAPRSAEAWRLVDGGGSTLACVSRDGEITGGLGERLGVVEPFDFSLQTQVALYALFLDPGLLSSEEE